MLHDFDNKQLPAATWVSQSIASGQASKAGHAVRIAHSEKPLDRPENECIHFLAGHRFFLCPEALVAALKFQAQIVCCLFQAGSPAEVQEAKSPGAELEGLERPERLPVAGFQRKAGRKAPDRGGLQRIPCQFLFIELLSSAGISSSAPRPEGFDHVGTLLDAA